MESYRYSLLFPHEIKNFCVTTEFSFGKASFNVMYLTRKSIMLLRKYPLVTEFQVSKCGSHIYSQNKKGHAISETYEI